MGDALEAAPGGYRLAADVDLQRFNALLEEGHAREALALWRGPSGIPALEEARLEALLALPDATLGELETAAAEHPLNEKLAARYIEALAAAGRQADALSAYERIRTRLDEELGALPSGELAAAHMSVLKAPTRRTSNLRAPVTSFVGREADLERIDSLLQTARLVTLVGPGGAGKTRLTGEALSRWVDRVKDGVWMVELAPVTADVEVVPAALAALGLRERALIEKPGGAPPAGGLERLVDALIDRETIIALDNCEHLIEAAAALADTLLAQCPGLRIVATSREPLAIAGENLVPVSPLAEKSAEQLFFDRARAASPGFVMTDEVGEICRRLDGLPLAIELAAARLRTMSVQQLAVRLDDRFRLLTGGSRAALPRHRTLRAVVDWSWGLLAEDERVLARRLGVFQAGATEESAAAVCGVEDALDGLTALAERSLVVAGPRYRMLETIREYALEKLDEAGEVEAVRGAHARWFSELVDRAEPELRRADQRIWFQRLQDSKDDVLAALRWYGDTGDARSAMHLAVRLLWFWVLSGSPDEAMAWIAFAAEIEGEADPLDRLIGEGLLMIREMAEQNAPKADELRGLAERLETLDTSPYPWLALLRPMFPMFAGRMDLVEQRLAETLEHPDPWVRATATMMRAHFAENHGDQVHMRSDLELAVAAYRELGDHWARAMALSSLAGTLSVVDDLDGAETALDEATALLDTLSGTAGSGMLRMRLSDIRVRRGDIAGARELAEEAVQDSDLDRDRAVVGYASVARLAWLDGDFEALRAQNAEAERRLERLGELRPEQGHAKALVEAMQALVALEDGDLERAHALAGQAIRTAAATQDMPITGMTGVVEATISLREGDVERAATQLGAAARLRGAEDLSNPEVGRLEAALRHPAYERARALAQDEALALLCPPVVGAQGERHEDGQ